MALKCEICDKPFRRIEDVYTHPYSFIRPRFVHRTCLDIPVRMLAAGGPHFTILTNLEMAVPSMILLSIIFIVFLSQLPISILFFLFFGAYVFIIFFRLHFMRYYYDAVISFRK